MSETRRVPFLDPETNLLPYEYLPNEYRNENEAEVLRPGNWSGAVDLSDVVGPKYIKAVLTGNTTLTLPTPSTGRALTLTLDLLQDSVGSRTLSVPGVLTAWSAALTLHPTPSSRTIIHLMWTGGDWVGVVSAVKVGAL